MLEKPETSQIKITNTSNKNITFDFHINDWPYSNKRQMAEFVKAMPNEFENEPLERKTWRFVKNYIQYEVPLTGDPWIHTPTLLLNSLGYGYCDDKANLLVQLWQKLGYTARTHHLNGHAVSEVLVDNKWRLYDSAYEVYYYNRLGEITGVEELSNFPSFITNPIKPFAYQHYIYDFEGNIINQTPLLSENTTKIDVEKRIKLFGYLTQYSSDIANLYNTKLDNNISQWGVENTWDIDTLWSLPPQSEIIFPLRIDNRSYIQVNVPKESVGFVKIPFVIKSIEDDNGSEICIKGKTTLSNEDLHIAKKHSTLAQKIEGEYVDTLSIVKNSNGMTILYYMTNLMELENKNSLVFKSEKKVRNLKVNTLLSQISKEQAILNKQINKVYKDDIYISSDLLKNYLVIQKKINQIENINDFYETIELYYSCAKDNILERSDIDLIKNKTRKLINYNPKFESFLLKKIKDISSLELYLNILHFNDFPELINEIKEVATE